MNQPFLNAKRAYWRKNLLCTVALAGFLHLAETASAQVIFGTVKTVAGVPVEGVLVRAIRTFPTFQQFTTTTDFSGGYVVGSGLSGTYQVQAIEATYTFTPASTNVPVSGASMEVNFTSPSTVPAAVTSSATNVTATSASLRGSVNPNGGATTAYFEYGLTASYGSVSGSTNVGSGTSSVPVSISVSNLLNGTNYHFRMVANNSHGTRTGSDTNFATFSGIPSATTFAPTDAAATSIRLNGSVNPNGGNATAWFEWGATTNYGNVTVSQFPGSGTVPTNFNQMMMSLVSGTYHYRAVAATSFATNHGADVLFTPGFSNINAGLPGLAAIARSSAAWGDYNNDGRLDILLSGTGISQVWSNRGSGFANINAGLPGVTQSAVAWGDYDNDDRLDILLTGVSSPVGAIAQVWRNTASGFTNINAGLPGVFDSSVAWGDYDNDGRRDILLAGLGELSSEVWRNTGSGFADINAGLPRVEDGSVAWGDYDNDGRLDILLTGFSDPNIVSQVWRNTGSGFADINAGLPGITQSSAAWGDYDNDGRLDILLTGTTNFQNNGAISQVWRNTGSGFTNINAELPGIYYGSAAWGDYDNDGRLDILLTGTTNFQNGGAISQVWRNTGSGFTDIGAGLPGLYRSSASWGDYDNDGRLDILLCGMTNGNAGVTSQVWRNHLPATNVAPTPPSGLSLTIANTTATLNWNPATDSQTPAAGLTYNLRIGTTPGGSDVFSSMSGANGFRRLPQLGSAQQGLTATFDYAVGTPYYWSVQAVDSAFAGSAFAPESSFKLLPAVVLPTATNIVSGDPNGDGIVSQAELDLVLSNYWPYSPWLYLTNVAGLGGTNVTFALPNSTASSFGVEYTTNFMDWIFLGPAMPRYLFTDTNAPAVPQRSYRLVWPLSTNSTPP